MHSWHKRTHRRLIIAAQLLRDHALHPHVQQPQRGQHTVDLYCRRPRCPSSVEIPRQKLLLELRAGRTRPDMNRQKVATLQSLLHERRPIPRGHELVKGQRPQDGPRAPSGARPSSSPRDPLPPIHSRMSSCSRKLRNHIRMTWLLFMAQSAPVRQLHLWRHISRKFYSHACAPQVTRTSYTTEKTYFFLFLFFHTPAYMGCLRDTFISSHFVSPLRTHDMSLRPSTLPLNTPRLQCAPTPGAHG
jgi:hypothetical protein